MVPADRFHRGVGCTQVVKPAVGDLVALGPGLLDHLAEEQHDRFLSDHPRRSDGTGPRRLLRRLDRREAGRVVERSEPRARVDLRAVGRDLVRTLTEDDVANENEAIVVPEEVGGIRIHLDVAALVLEVADVGEVALADSILLVGGDTLGHGRLRVGARRRRAATGARTPLLRENVAFGGRCRSVS